MFQIIAARLDGVGVPGNRQQSFNSISLGIKELMQNLVKELAAIGNHDTSGIEKDPRRTGVQSV